MTKAIRADAVERWINNPADMVRDLFEIEPDAWQLEVLSAFPRHPQQAMKASKGVGKTSCLAWLCWNFLLTRPRPKIGAVSITRQNLDDGLWSEMAKWMNADKTGLLNRLFVWQKDRIYAKEQPAEWFMAAKSFKADANAEQQANTLAGFHADYVMFVLDEVGGMTDAVMAAAEAALSSCVEGHIVMAGNPTHLSGPLYRASTTGRNKPWWVKEISSDPDDPKRSQRVSIEWAREQIATYGRDNPWVLVNVFGQFPPSSLNVLIGPDEVRAAMGRVYQPHDIESQPKILGIDVARFGDDESVIYKRQGLQAFTPERRRNLNGVQGAGLASRVWGDWGADACFIDDTGGFGATWIDQLSVLGRAPVGIHFAGSANDATRYFNRRAEMYFLLVEWIRKGGALPPDSERLLQALTQTTYMFKGDRFILEPKEQVKDKIGFSPDEADAAALTFAMPVTKVSQGRTRNARYQSDYDPFAAGLGHAVAASMDYDPFR